MKAVEFSYCDDGSGSRGFVPFGRGGYEPNQSWWTSQLKLAVLEAGQKLTVRYDNGQLCTFKRKEKRDDRQTR